MGLKGWATYSALAEMQQILQGMSAGLFVSSDGVLFRSLRFSVQVIIPRIDSKRPLGGLMIHCIVCLVVLQTASFVPCFCVVH